MKLQECRPGRRLDPTARAPQQWPAPPSARPLPPPPITAEGLRRRRPCLNQRSRQRPQGPRARRGGGADGSAPSSRRSLGSTRAPPDGSAPCAGCVGRGCWRRSCWHRSCHRQSAASFAEGGAGLRARPRRYHMRHRARPQIRTRVPACARAPAAAEPPGWMHLPHDLPACRAGTSRSPRRLADGWFGGMPASKRRKPRGPAPCPCGCGDLQRRDPRASDSVRSPWRRFAERLANPNFDKLL